MAEYRIPAFIEHARESSESGGVPPGDACGTHLSATFPMVGDGAPFTVRLDIPLDAELLDVTLDFRGGFIGTLYTRAGSTTWVLTGAAAGATLANGVVAFQQSSGNTISVAGAVAPITNVAATFVTVSARWRRGINGGVFFGGSNWEQPVSSLVGMFSNDADDDNPITGQLLGMFAREERRLQSQAGNCLIQRAGAPGGTVSLQHCTMGYADPWGRVVLTAADLGAGNGQVPTDRTFWQSQQFLNQPQSFVRLGGGRMRSIGAARRWSVFDTLPLTSPIQETMALYTVARAPLYSTWWCIIDGIAQELTFRHPAGSNIQRPADIWNAVIVPYMLAMSAGGGPGINGAITQTTWTLPSGPQQPGGVGTNTGVGPAVTYEVHPGVGVFPVAAPVFPAPIFRQRQQLPRRFSFLTYARLLHLWDDQSPYGNPILTPVPTTPQP